MKKGLVVINIGTPDSYETKSVGQYLKRFLMDEDVISIPFFFRWILVHCIIVPIRASKSAAKYKKVWTPKGSPLKVITDEFVIELQKQLPDVAVKAGMTFSEPSIYNSLSELKQMGINHLTIAPLFPQYADATTGSILKNVKRILKEINFNVDTQVMKPFYKEDFYIDELNEVCQRHAEGKNIKHWLFSYHGLPENQITKNSDCKLAESCCLSQKDCTKKCYRSHSVQTTRALAKKLNLNSDQYSMTFQSRLGAQKWLRPYTDNFLTENSRKIESIAVVCPAFVADCLETLEEIDIENRQVFKDNGGVNFTYVPCLNSDKKWVRNFAQYLTDSKNTVPL